MIYAAEALKRFAQQLFESAGLAPERAAVMAGVFLEADLMGFTTHGMNRISSNLEWLENGSSRKTGEPRVLRDSDAIFSWDAEFLPGPWICTHAVQETITRASKLGMAAGVIRRSQHIACLAAYLPQILANEYLGLMIASTPAENTVCAHGGFDPVFSANPIAMAIPSSEEPIFFDISTSITACGYVARALRENTHLQDACLKDNRGNISDNPADLFTSPPGSILPIGGTAHGYKGFALSLLTEVFTMALGGYGRADEASSTDGEANSVFILVIDPNAFGSLDAFTRETDYLRQLCQQSKVRDGEEKVRIPGHRAWQRRQRQLATGVELYPTILPDLKPWGEKYDIATPTALIQTVT